MVFLVLVMFVIMPQVSLLLAKTGYHSPRLSDTLALLEQCNSVLMHAFIYAYVMFFGSCIASFLNVVAWRVPRGRSILGSSHCPGCDHKLSMRDNIPIWGWLKNEGQCRHCQSPISQRYLWVEVLLGILFLVLFFAEIVFAGFNLPTAPDLHYTGIAHVLFSPNAQLIQTFAFHAALVSILFTIAMIAGESFRIPLSYIAISGLILAGIAFFCPVVLQVSWQALPTLPANETLVPFNTDSLLTMALGAATGVAAGVSASFVSGLAGTSQPPVARQQLIASFSLVGFALGWQSILVTLSIWLLLSAVSRTHSNPNQADPNQADPNAGNSCPTDQGSGVGSGVGLQMRAENSTNCDDSHDGGSWRQPTGPALVLCATLLHILTWRLIYSY